MQFFLGLLFKIQYKHPRKHYYNFYYFKNGNINTINCHRCYNVFRIQMITDVLEWKWKMGVVFNACSMKCCRKQNVKRFGDLVFLL